MPESASIYSCGQIEIDLGRRELRVQGVPAALGDRAFALIEVLIGSSGELVSKDELMRHVWRGVVVEENTLEVLVSAVRRALGPDRALLRTAYGRGYRLIGSWTMQETSKRGDPKEPVAIRVTSPIGSNLPLGTFELIGRAVPAVQVGDLLSAHRLVTLTGLGGIGKTRLAIEVARRRLESFGGDVRLAELAPLSDAGLVPSVVATAIGLRLGAAAPVAATVARAIGSRRLLLVLDNCEHVIDAVAGLAEAIIRECPHARILATSREDLRAEEEWVYQVPPLDLPAPHLREPDLVLGHGAVALFVERMRASRAGFSPREEDLPTIAAICHRLDGVPLAIEFAAARAHTLGLRQVLSRLDDRFGLLTGGRRTAPPRHQTLRATLDWSYQLLPEIERQMLRRVAVMAGGFTIEAATAILDGGKGPDEAQSSAALESLPNLVGKALIVLEESDPAITRWRLLDTVRAYALEKLAENGDTEETARRHAQFFRDLFVPTDGDRRLAPTVERMAIYGREIDNVRAALDWAFSAAGDRAIGVSLTAAYLPYLLQLSSMAECRDRAERALSRLAGAGLSTDLEAQLHITLGLALVYTTSQVERTGEVLARAVEIAASAVDVDLLLQALWATFIYKLNNGEHREAQSFAERFSDLAQRAGDPEDVLMGDRVTGTIMHYAGNQPEARRHYDRYLQRYSAPRLHRHLTWLHYDGPVLVKTRLSRVLWLQGLVDQARLVAEQNVHEARALDHPMSECLALGEAACPIAAMTGDFEAAQQYLAMLAEIATRQSFSFWLSMAKCLEAKLLIWRGEAARGAALLQIAIDSLGTAQQSMHYAGFVPDLALGVATTGDLIGAIAIVDEALIRAERSGVQWHVPELLRLKGELLLRSPDASTTASSEACFQSALKLAARQNALFWELRASLSLARLWLREGRGRDGCRLLAPVYARFTEGFDTADLRSAKALLEGSRGKADL